MKDKQIILLTVLILAVGLAHWVYVEAVAGTTPVPLMEVNLLTAPLYSVSTAEELAKLAHIVNGTWAGWPKKHNFKGKTVILTADIDLAAYDNWMPIGNGKTYEIYFAGVFDGGGHVISSLTINRSDSDYNSGLFGIINQGTVMNLGLENVNISGAGNVGGLAGSLDTRYRDPRSRVINCYSTGTVRGAGDDVGGLAGSISGSHIAGSYSTASVYGRKYTGGLVGHATFYSSVSSSYSAGAVTGDDYVGGVIGRVNNSEVIRCAALNPEVKAVRALASHITGIGDDWYQLGRVAGEGDNGNGSSPGNAAYERLIINAGGNTSGKQVDTYRKALNGADLTAQKIRADGTIGGRFTRENGWTVEDGMLPGLLGRVAEMPEHLRDQVNHAPGPLQDQMNGAQAEYGYFDNPANQCSDKRKYECVSTFTAKVDVDCDGVPDSVVVKDADGAGFMRIFDQNGVYKDYFLYYANRGSFLAMIQLPFDPAIDAGYVCSQRILNFFYNGEVRLEQPFKQNGLGEIKHIIKNSIKKAPGEWMEMADFDTTFGGYAAVISPQDFSKLGTTQSKWIKSYYPTEEADSLLARNTKGLLISYLAHNHLIRPAYSIPGKEPVKDFLTIPVSDGAVIYQTAHGVLLRKGDKIRWVYFSDMQERLRWPSVEKVTVSNGRINLFLRDDAEQGEEEPKPALRFLLKDLLK